MPTNQQLGKRLTDQQLLDMANYYAGGCLCGHFESCEVCSRSEKVRTLEQSAKWAALELLDARGVPVFEDREDGDWGRKVYVIKENLKPVYAPPPPNMGGYAEGDTYVIEEKEKIIAG